MKILAIEKEIASVNWSLQTQALAEEAQTVYQFLLKGNLREIYFTENKNAVLVLECENKESAMRLLEDLPLVRKKWIAFEFLELHPYTGFSRLMTST